MSLDDVLLTKRILPVVLLALLWGWESWRPFFGHRERRWTHALRNLALATCNTVILGLLFGTVTAAVAEWTTARQVGLLHRLGVSESLRFALALLLLDGWMYVWHRANHVLPLLWRFHRMHHSDPRMDVTTATRFHLGEHVGSSVLRLGLIPVLGLDVWNLVVYDALVIAITQFHHADVSLGRWDAWLRLVVVTPDMHKVHHSDRVKETDSNYSTVLSMWDRLARTFRMRADVRAIVFGLEEYRDDRWQSGWGLWKTPFTGPGRRASSDDVTAPPTDP